MTLHLKASQLSEWVTRDAARTRRYLFGIAGPPGSGKSTITRRLAEDLDAPVVEMDGFHLPNAELDARGLRNVKGAPETFDGAGFVDLVERLRSADVDVLAPRFDRRRDKALADAVRVTRDARVVLLEGNYILLDEPPWSRLATLLDATCYVHVGEDELRRRLIRRHMRFGRTQSEAANFVDRSDLANACRVTATESRADIIVEQDREGIAR